MKVYVDELPKSCLECKCAFKTQRQRINENGSYMEDCMMCIPLGESVIERHNICPLQSISDYTKQVRKEVCEEIKEFLENHKYRVFGDYNHQTLQYDETYICEMPEINKFLDQIQGE